MAALEPSHCDPDHYPERCELLSLLMSKQRAVWHVAAFIFQEDIRGLRFRFSKNVQSRNPHMDKDLEQAMLSVC
jgi:hypothetical protein